MFALLPWEDEEEVEVTVALADRISHDPDRICKLARLAVAFAPPGHTLTLQDLEHVEVVCVDEQHIEIAAVMCEEECVSVLVPVSFPHSCANGSLEECVLMELDELDEFAEVQISNMKAQEEEEENEDSLLCPLDRPCEYPTWWVKPDGLTKMYDDCNLVMNLLNDDDFAYDLKALATRGMWESLGADGYDFEVKKAVVAEVGLAGIYLRAKAKKIDEDGVRIIEIPIQYGGDLPHDTNSLRAAVLGTVASVHVEA